MKTKLLIALADGRIHKLKLGSFLRSFREAPLTATTLAALVPPELDFDIKIADESVQKIPFDENFDIVAISCLTGTTVRAYEIADYFRKKGSTIILGGVHVTLMPDEAAQHADSIVIGFAEQTWPQLLRDYKENKLQKRYKSTESQYYNMPLPRRDLQKKGGYMIPNTVSATRGCKGVCDFCSVSAANFGWNVRPISEVIEEIKQIETKRFVFNDVSMGEDMQHFKELLRELIPLKKNWGGLVSTKIFSDPEIAPLLRKSGCVYLLIGFESLNDYSLRGINKGFNKIAEYQYIIETLRANNIVLMGCFIFGFDDDNLDIFQKTLDFVNKFRVDIPRYAIYTPYPGTPAFERLQNENRLLHKNWRHYDTQHVVFQPKNMTAQQLNDGFLWAYKNTFTISSSLRRTIKTGKNFPITFGGNLAYNIYIKRLFSEKNRILSE